MNILTTITDWIKNNKWIAIAAGASVLFLLFGKKLLRNRTVRRRRVSKAAPYVRRKTTKRAYTTGGKAKKPWQVKGSLAAKRYMAALRRKR